MKIVTYQSIVDAVAGLCTDAAANLPPDVLAALENARGKETSLRAQGVLDQCIENAKLAAAAGDPICQDTGVAVYYVELGSDVLVSGGTLPAAIDEGTRRGYTEAYLRKSLVRDPLFDRTNTGDNTPAMVHLEIVPGEALSITHLPKGGGSENVSGLAMLKPSEGRSGVVEFVVSTVVRAGGNPCPPVIVGVGIGGTADKVMWLAKKALLRPVGQPHPDARYAELEAELLRSINASGVGPQGLGGSTTALAVHIETLPCHIAALPLGVTVNCHAARRATVTL